MLAIGTKGPRHTIIYRNQQIKCKTSSPAGIAAFLHFNFDNPVDYDHLISYLIPAGFYEDKI